jgi:hypothetical protein
MVVVCRKAMPSLFVPAPCVCTLPHLPLTTHTTMNDELVDKVHSPPCLHTTTTWTHKVSKQGGSCAWPATKTKTTQKICLALLLLAAAGVAPPKQRRKDDAWREKTALGRVAILHKSLAGQEEGGGRGEKGRGACAIWDGSQGKTRQLGGGRGGEGGGGGGPGRVGRFLLPRDSSLPAFIYFHTCLPTCLLSAKNPHVP